MSLIDTSLPLSFTFDGEAYQGFEGDTLASALLRAGVRVLGRSFKYHRPRGVMGAGSEEPNALVEIHKGDVREPNRRATTIRLYEGLDARSQNSLGSRNFDLLAINDVMHRFLSAGFYYKTFMWPKAFWEKVYEPAIRRAAGLGRLSHAPDPDSYDKGFLFCDTLVVGGGPAGLQTALSLGRASRSVILVDDDFLMGGRLLSEDFEVNNADSADWIAATVAELRSLPNVRLLQRTTIYGVFDHGTYGALEVRTDRIGQPGPRQILWKITAQSCVLATGATERSIAFANNDRPGVMLASAVRTYRKRFGLNLPDTVLFTNNDDGLRTNADHVIDTRNGNFITDVTGRRGVRRVSLGSGETRRASILAVSGGWNPNVHLTCHKRGRPVWDETLACFRPDTDRLPSDMIVIGAANAAFSTHAAFREANAAAERLGATPADLPSVEDASLQVSAFWQVPGTKRAWVDVQNDVTVKDITLAHQEGFSSVEHVKRYTTLGMATDQGRTSNVLGLAVLADATGQTIPQTGTTIFRPPYTPISIGALAGAHRGQHFKPLRLTPSHAFAAELGAEFVETGYWRRAQWFARPGEQGWRDSVDREVRMTRNSVGICDVTTLGKIDVQGRDAGKFLNHAYVNTFSTLKVGKCRYGLMLREDGIAMDDGTTARLSDTHFITTTTTAKAGPVFRHLEFLRQCLYPEMDVHLTSTTDQWAQFSVAGPNARKLLELIVDPEHDISNEAFPYMACGERTVCGGTRARLFRLSFSGELAYEVSVPARYGDALVRRMLEVGKPFDAILYGTEALGVMRIEKGHAAGNELNGTTTAQALGLGGFVSKKKDCIGKVLSARGGMVGDDTLQMVGFKPVDASARLTNGAHLLDIGAAPTPGNDLGYLSSVAWSPMLETYIALGFVKGGRARMGERLRAVDFMRDNHVDVEVVSPHFFDPEGGRLRV